MPEPQTLDRTTDTARWMHLGATLARIADITRHRMSQPHVLHEQLIADLDVIGRGATAALDRGIVRTSFEYEVLWHADGDDERIRMTEDKISTLARARKTGRSRIGQYGVTHYSVQRCNHVVFDGGWVVIGPWEAVDDRGLLFNCAGCGLPVFRAAAFDSATTWFLDAAPTPDGDLVLLPSDDDGGQPTAVYGEAPKLGQRRYRHHRSNCAPAPDIIAETALCVPPSPPFSHITVRHPDGGTEHIDVPSHVRMPDGTLSNHAMDRVRVPLAHAGYRVVRVTPVRERDVNAWVVERIPADAAAAGRGVS